MLKLDLSLSGGHGMPAVSIADDAARDAVLARDNCTCQFCGFYSKKYQLVRQVPLDGKIKKTLGLDDFVTACIFCDQCLRIDDVVDMKSGVLIWLPEFSQAQLHHLIRAIYVARISQGGIADAARRALDVLLARREQAIKRMRTDDPAVLSAVLSDFISPKAYQNRTPKLDGIRLLPLDRRMVREGELEFNQFPQILAYWRSKDGPYGAFMPNTWGQVFLDFENAKQAA